LVSGPALRTEFAVAAVVAGAAGAFIYQPISMQLNYVVYLLVEVGKKIILKFSEKCCRFPKNALEKVAEMIVQFVSPTKTTNFEPKDFENFFKKNISQNVCHFLYYHCFSIISA